MFFGSTYNKLLIEQLKRSVKWLIRYLPKIVIYFICATEFFINVVPLIKNYLSFQTIVMVQYQIPEEITFPAFTVCGCCVRQIIRNDTYTKIADDEFELMKQEPMEDLFHVNSFKWNDFVVNCTFIYDVRQTNYSESCTKLTTVLESIHDGRKCVTMFTTVPDDVQTVVKRMKNSERYTSYIYVEIDFPGMSDVVIGDNSLLTADTVFTLHSPNVIPTMLDVEFFRLGPYSMYETQFTKDITNLLPYPFTTECENYDTNQKPRSKSECINICIIVESYKRYNCINYHSVLTKGILNHTIENYHHLMGTDPKFCPTRGYQSYNQYVLARVYCMKQCSRDCIEENYKLNIDISETDYAEMSTKSVILIWPNREMYQLVQHEGELSFVELIGCLGGHAHIWLGLSAIQFYDVMVKLFLKGREQLKTGFTNLQLCNRQ